MYIIVMYYVVLQSAVQTTQKKKLLSKTVAKLCEGDTWISMQNLFTAIKIISILMLVCIRHQDLWG